MGRPDVLRDLAGCGSVEPFGAASRTERSGAVLSRPETATDAVWETPFRYVSEHSVGCLRRSRRSSRSSSKTTSRPRAALDSQEKGLQLGGENPCNTTRDRGARLASPAVVPFMCSGNRFCKGQRKHCQVHTSLCVWGGAWWGAGCGPRFAAVARGHHLCKADGQNDRGNPRCDLVSPSHSAGARPHPARKRTADQAVLSLASIPTRCRIRQERLYPRSQPARHHRRGVPGELLDLRGRRRGKAPFLPSLGRFDRLWPGRLTGPEPFPPSTTSRCGSRTGR